MDNIGYTKSSSTPSEDLSITGKMEIRGVKESIKDIEELQNAIAEYQQTVKSTVWTRILERFVVKFTSTKFIISIISLMGIFYCMNTGIVPVKEGVMIIGAILGSYGFINFKQKKLENENSN